MLIAMLGKPSSGKSTFFKAATLAEVDIAPYPFTTLTSKEGAAFVKVDCVDKEFNKQCNPRYGYCLNNKRFVPIKIMDVPGLIPGSHKGLGKGNAFLDDLRQADALIHILDISGTTDEKGESTQNYDPCSDVKFLENEIDMWFFSILKKNWEKFSRTVKQENKELYKEIAKQLTGLKINEDEVKKTMKSLNLDNNPLKWTDENLKEFTSELRKISKPIIIAANKIDMQNSEKNLEKLKKEFPEYKIIPCSAESELALREATKHNLIEYIAGENKFKIINEAELNEKQKKGLEFMKSFLEKHKTTGVQEILNEAVFSLLNYIVVYPVENENKLTDIENRILPDAHLLPKDSTALDLAFKIHTDIGSKFVAAIDARTKRRLAKDYKLKNNDVIKIMTN
jgi:ribosome-binding ATPase YchF (GTP1/OBG family)